MSRIVTVQPTATPRFVRTAPSRRWRIAGGVTAFLTTAVALVSYRYLAGIDEPPPLIAANTFRDPWLVLHAGFGATALLVGAAQFNHAIRTSRPTAHRIVGRLYAVSCLVGGGAGAVLALGTAAGPAAALGFGLLAAAWMLSTALGWRAAVRKSFVAHRRWMARSWALTLSAVTLRLQLTTVEVLDLPFLASYQAIAFLCWVPNLIAAEWLLRVREQPSPFRGSETVRPRIRMG